MMSSRSCAVGGGWSVFWRFGEEGDAAEERVGGGGGGFESKVLRCWAGVRKRPYRAAILLAHRTARGEAVVGEAHQLFNGIHVDVDSALHRSPWC
jgi:hypothetical protein